MGITMLDDADDGTEPLELTEAQEVGFEDEAEASEPTEEVVISFGEDGDAEEADETPLVKKLRDQNRQYARELKRMRTAPASSSDDPEPGIPARPSLEALDYDQDKFDAAIDAREEAIKRYAAWERRNEEREAVRKRQADDEAKQVEQQVKSLGVSDYQDRASAVRDRLTDQQMAVLINAAENKAKLLYALGRSETKLEELASIDNLARFAARCGQLEKEIRVAKKQAPAPESRVRGATASTAVSDDSKELAKLEAEADRTGDRSKIVAYRRQLRQRDAA